MLIFRKLKLTHEGESIIKYFGFLIIPISTLLILTGCSMVEEGNVKSDVRSQINKAFSEEIPVSSLEDYSISYAYFTGNTVKPNKVTWGYSKLNDPKELITNPIREEAVDYFYGPYKGRKVVSVEVNKSNSINSFDDPKFKERSINGKTAYTLNIEYPTERRIYFVPLKKIFVTFVFELNNENMLSKDDELTFIKKFISDYEALNQ